MAASLFELVVVASVSIITLGGSAEWVGTHRGYSEHAACCIPDANNIRYAGSVTRFAQEDIIVLLIHQQLRNTTRIRQVVSLVRPLRRRAVIKSSRRRF